jgi:hypothetical protein
MSKELTVSQFCQKDRYCVFSHYRQGYLYYEVEAWVELEENTNQQLQTFVFPVEVADLGGATVNKIEKSVTMMRYVRKAIEDGTMARIWPKPEKVL